MDQKITQKLIEAIRKIDYNNNAELIFQEDFLPILNELCDCEWTIGFKEGFEEGFEQGFEEGKEVGCEEGRMS